MEGSSSGLLLKVIKSTEGDVDREKKKSADLEFYFVLVYGWAQSTVKSTYSGYSTVTASIIVL